MTELLKIVLKELVFLLPSGSLNIHKYLLWLLQNLNLSRKKISLMCLAILNIFLLYFPMELINLLAISFK